MQLTDRYVNTFFESLEQGKFVGQKCNDCGTYQAFPVPVCNNCQGMDLSWVELKKEGQLLFFDVQYFPSARFASFGAPCALGLVQLADGPAMQLPVEGINLEDPAQDRARLPLAVDILIKELGGNAVPIAKVR